MKKRFAMICAVGCILLLFCFYGREIQKYEPPPKVIKKIIEKASPNENRFSAGEFIFGKGSITKTQTVYYLVADDGMVCEVGMTLFHKTKLGDSVACDCWVEK